MTLENLPGMCYYFVLLYVLRLISGISPWKTPQSQGWMRWEKTGSGNEWSLTLPLPHPSIAQLVNNPLSRRPRFNSRVGKTHWRDRLPTPVFLGFPGSSAGKESAYNVGDLGSIPGLGRSPGEGKGYPLQYSGLENSMDCIVHGVAKSQIRLSDFHSLHSLLIVSPW